MFKSSVLRSLAAAFVCGCATTDPPTPSPSTAVPSNYRQLVVRRLAETTDLTKVRHAEISRPGLWVGPWGLGGSRPIVCAQFKKQGPIIEQTFVFAFTFENGQIAETFDPGYVNPAAGGAFAAALKHEATCGKLSYTAFPEIARAK